MSLPIQIVCVVAATLALFCAPALLLARGAQRGESVGVGTKVAAMAIRLVLAAVLAIGLLVSRVEHAVALVLTLGATYFAMAIVEGVRGLQRRESPKCLAR